MTGPNRGYLKAKVKAAEAWEITQFRINADAPTPSKYSIRLLILSSVFNFDFLLSHPVAQHSTDPTGAGQNEFTLLSRINSEQHVHPRPHHEQTDDGLDPQAEDVAQHFVLHSGEAGSRLNTLRSVRIAKATWLPTSGWWPFSGKTGSIETNPPQGG